MNDIDLWNEAEYLVNEHNERPKNKKMEQIGEELFELFNAQYNTDDFELQADELKLKIDKDKDIYEFIDMYCGSIYKDIWNGMTFKKSFEKYNKPKQRR
tara:strand:- start:237 stop:533 length:297 start_codon:yes stop_codon:yes gene_type:complete